MGVGCKIVKLACGNFFVGKFRKEFRRVCRCRCRFAGNLHGRDSGVSMCARPSVAVIIPANATLGAALDDDHAPVVNLSAPSASVVTGRRDVLNRTNHVPIVTLKRLQLNGDHRSTTHRGIVH